MKRILVHGSGHRAASWDKAVSYMQDKENILCPDLRDILNGEEASYRNLYAAFAQYCGSAGEQVHLCGLSLGGILALDYALDFPDRVKSLVLIGTPYKVPRLVFAVQNIVFKLLPGSAFSGMAFDKKDTFALGSSMKGLDFSGRVQGVKCPVLVVCGEKDGANMKAAQYLGQNIPGARLEIVEKAGHVVNEEAPEALARLLNGFYGGVK